MKILRLFGFLFLFLFFLNACRPPHCPLPACHIRMKHRHGETEFRGVPWWKRNKDPKIGEDYKDPNAAEEKKKSDKEAKRRKKEVAEKKKESLKQ
jgi:hypothetical protein